MEEIDTIEHNWSQNKSALIEMSSTSEKTEELSWESTKMLKKFAILIQLILISAHKYRANLG